jgi:hypothetical protein
MRYLIEDFNGAEEVFRDRGAGDWHDAVMPERRKRLISAMPPSGARYHAGNSGDGYTLHAS